MGSILHVFSEFAHASQAREALLFNGFALDSVSLESREEETGPVQGDFILACKGGDDRVPSVQRGTLLLMVEIQSDAQERLVRAIVAEAAYGDDGEKMEQ